MHQIDRSLDFRRAAEQNFLVLNIERFQTAKRRALFSDRPGYGLAQQVVVGQPFAEMIAKLAFEVVCVLERVITGEKSASLRQETLSPERVNCVKLGLNNLALFRVIDQRGYRLGLR